MTPDFTLVYQSASLPINATNINKWYECRKTSRLPLGPNQLDMRFFINAMQISRDTFCVIRWVQQIHAWLWYVPINGNGRVTTFVQVNSLAKRLLLDKKDIYAAARTRTLHTLIDKAFAAVPITDAITKLKNDRNPDQKAIALHMAAKKAIQIATQTFPPNLPKDGQPISVEENRRKYEFIATYDNQRLLVVDSPHNVDQLHDDKFIYKVRDYVSFQFKILKFGEKKPNTPLSTRNEIAILQAVHKNGHKCYLQDPPDAVITVPKYAPKESSGLGYIGTFYENGDLMSFNESKPHQIRRTALGLRLFLPLISALHQMHEADVYHGDLKPENIMLVNNRASVKIIDFECSALCGDDLNFPGYPALHTSGYSTIDELMKCRQEANHVVDVTALASAKRKIKADKDVQLSKEERAALDHVIAKNKRDVFAIGVVLYGVFKGYGPFQADENGYPLPSAVFDHYTLANIGIDQRVINLLRQMTELDPAKRITSEQASRIAQAINWKALAAPAIA